MVDADADADNDCRCLRETVTHYGSSQKFEPSYCMTFCRICWWPGLMV